MHKVTTIDLGSNSFRVLIYDCLNNEIINEYNEVTGMADKLHETNIISKEAQERVINAIKHSSNELNYEPKDAICVTTAAMRLANNSQEVLKNFQINTGAKFTIIDGKEEARLTLLAVKYALKREKINSSKFILLDIGGGSTEIIVNNNEKFESHSFNFGIVTLTQKYFKYDGVLKELEKHKVDIEDFLDELPPQLEPEDLLELL